METFVGHRSALRYLRSLHSVEGLPRTSARPQLEAPPSSPDLRKALGISGQEARNLVLQRSGQFLLAPIDLVIASANLKRKRSFAVTHVWPSPEKGKSFIGVGEGLFVSSPEACFAQMAKYLDVVQLARLGFELCGTYSLDRSMTAGFVKRRPLCSRKSLLRYVEKLPGRSGVERARRALQFVRDGSASPMETRLALLLGLPASMGGYGLGMPEMNVEVKAPAGKRTNASWGVYHCDLYWRAAKVAVEYNSTLYHTGEDAILHDSERMNDMAAFGVDVLVVTRPQIADPNRMETVAEIVSKMLGQRLRGRCSDWELRKMQLRRTLFEPDGFL